MSTLSSLINRVSELAAAIGDALQLRGFKTGGTAGQVPKKSSGTDFAWSWGSVAWSEVASKPSTFPPVIGSGAADAVAGNDPRLTDDRDPTAHTHPLAEVSDAGTAAAADLIDDDTFASATANNVPSAESVKAYVDASGGGWDGNIADINLDGGTDIGADLADADLILVDDGAGGTNRKSAMSRVWTYISGKLSGYTAAGAWAFSSTTRPTSAGTGTPAATSLITLDDGDARFGPFSPWFPVHYGGGVSVVASGGAASEQSSGMGLSVTAAVNSRAKRGYAMAARLFEHNAGINFGRRIVLSFKLSNSSLTGLQTNVIGYIQFGRSATDTAMGPLAGTNKGFGMSMSVATCTPFVYDGTTLTTTLASGSTFSWKTYPRIIFDFRPGVSFDVYGITVTGTTPVLLASITAGLPTGSSSLYAGMDAFEALIYTTAGTHAGDLAITNISAAAY